MKIKTWKKKFDGAPIDTFELAESLSEVVDAAPLTEAAAKLCAAHDEFEKQLDLIGYERG